MVFISGNMPMRTEIVPLLIMTKLEQFDYQGATAIAVVMLVASFMMLLLINLLQRWTGTLLRGMTGVIADACRASILDATAGTRAGLRRATTEAPWVAPC